MKNILIAVWLSVPVLMGCERVVNIDVEEGPERLVVEGRIERHQDDREVAQSIRLSTTAPYFSNESTPVVSGAEVIVHDDEGTTYLFAESSRQAGMYENRDMRPEVGRTYTLEIDLNGESYRAVETLLPVAPIDSIYQQFEKANSFEDGGIRVKIDYQDVPGREDYYLWEQFADGVLQAEPDPGNSLNFVGSDEFFDGENVIGFEPNQEATVKSDQLVLVRQLSLSKEAFEYYFLLFEQTGQDPLFPTPAALIRGNIENLTNPQRYALGYFGASEVDTAELQIVEDIGP